MTGAPIEADGGGTLRVTSDFGEFHVALDDIITFPSGLPGFETSHRFVVLSTPEFAPLKCLQAVDDPSPSFIVVDPRQVLEGYRARLNQSDLVRLGAPDDGALLWLALVTVVGQGAYVNLRAPVVINPARMLGFQLVPSDSLYPLRHPLFVE